jgi:outer membrane protein OmpA-like peptidoglycan-associated protein
MFFRLLLFCGLTIGTLSNLYGQQPFDSLLLHRIEQVYFDFGKHELRPAGDSLLTGLAAEIREDSFLFLKLMAHTDAIGSTTSNLDLSRRRGRTVADTLIAKGLAPDRIDILKLGERLPAASNDTEEGRQQNRRVEIYVYGSYQMTMLEGQVKDKTNGEGIPAEITLRNRYWQDTLSTQPDGRFRTPVPDGVVIGVDVQAPGYFFDSQMLKTDSHNPKQLEIKLPKAEAGLIVAIENLYFVGNQDTLLKRSEPELPKLLKFMQLNPDLKVEISGHINYPNRPPVDTSSWNYGLSTRRAKRVYEYLVEKGIDPQRMTYKGYGNWQMKFPKARTEREQALNRRVEIKVIE